MIALANDMQDLQGGRWDAVVMGAGPAGAIAARQLALAGARVLLVDKARLPRDKVCGGCLGGAALNVLESIGLGEIPAVADGVPLSTFTLASSRATARVPIGRRIAVSRRSFDAALVQEAVRAGATVRSGAAATLAPVTSREVRGVLLRHQSRVTAIDAKVVMVATGLAAPPAGCLSRSAARSRVGLGAILDHTPCHVAPGELVMACGPLGYVGVTGVEAGRYDVAAAIDPRALTARSPGAVVADILTQSGRKPTIDLEAVSWHGTPPLTRSVTPLAFDRCLLIGDAAAYVEPFTGEGIGWAMHSAVLVAELVSRYRGYWGESIVQLWPAMYARALAHRQRSCRVLSQSLRIAAIRHLMTFGLSHVPALSIPIVQRLDRSFVPAKPVAV
jgi:flavin-dependent dehydrogenase